MRRSLSHSGANSYTLGAAAPAPERPKVYRKKAGSNFKLRHYPMPCKQGVEAGSRPAHIHTCTLAQREVQLSRRRAFFSGPERWTISFPAASWL